ncbi:hypothetical protein NDU88_000051 [Pleurodeles waltl]|uniref:Uncharacterized protein n=1 Tax=Pleurodeles waltl TaxID=8319 RepID=A0AAV7KP29_PLEWA|nr:hypothetical protein NDU88_000051 [Pleurodeles waltl]
MTSIGARGKIRDATAQEPEDLSRNLLDQEPPQYFHDFGSLRLALLSFLTPGQTLLIQPAKVYIMFEPNLVRNVAVACHHLLGLRPSLGAASGQLRPLQMPLPTSVNADLTGSLTRSSVLQRHCLAQRLLRTAILPPGRVQSRSMTEAPRDF